MTSRSILLGAWVLTALLLFFLVMPYLLPYPSAKGVALNSFVQLVDIERTHHCSGVAVGPAAVLTATHCEVYAGEDSILFNDAFVHVDRQLRDGNDHTILLLREAQFEAWAAVDQRDLKQGDTIQVLGSPLELVDMLRLGVVAGTMEGATMDKPMLALDFNGEHGDSGAPVFDNAWKVRGVISEVEYAQPPSLPSLLDLFSSSQRRPALMLKMMGAYPLRFTIRQIREAREYRSR